MKHLLLLVFLIHYSFNAHATRYYVDANAMGTGSGTSWTNAFTDLQMALSAAFFGDEIWVAAGTYKPTSSTDRSVSFVLRDGVNIYGSFAGTETAVSQRNIAANLSTLSGDIGQLGQRTDNSRHIITGYNLSSNITVDGFRIVSGYSNSTGGGLELERNLNGLLLLKNCYFYNNRAFNYGGAIYLYSANLTLEDCEFINNESNSDGGTIYNGAGNGGGLSTLIIRDSEFRNNIANNSGACLSNADDYQSLLIDRCLFTNNFSSGDIINITDFGTAKILNSAIIGNRVDGSFSNVLYVRTGSVNESFELTNCTIADNFNVYSFSTTAEIIDLDETHFEVNNCIIYGNTTHQGRQISNNAIASNSLIEGGYAGGSNILDLDPLFTNANTSATTNFDATQYDYTLSNNSPAINVGNNSFVDTTNHGWDLNLDARIQGTIVDMGAYESNVVLSSQVLAGSNPSTYRYSSTSDLVFFDNEQLFLGQQLQIYTTNGQLVKSKRVLTSPMKLNLTTGVYLIAVEGKQSLKIIVQ